MPMLVRGARVLYPSFRTRKTSRRLARSSSSVRNPRHEQVSEDVEDEQDETEVASASDGRRRRRGRAGRAGAGTRDAGPAQAVRAPDRRRAAAHGGRGARARAPEGSRRRDRQAPSDRVQPPAGHVDRPQLHELRRPAPGSHPGGQSRAHPGGREVRRQSWLQALDLRDLVDPAGRLARDRRPGEDHPPARSRRRPGAARHAREAGPDAEARPRPRDRERSPPRPGSSRSA